MLSRAKKSDFHEIWLAQMLRASVGNFTGNFSELNVHVQNRRTESVPNPLAIAQPRFKISSPKLAA